MNLILLTESDFIGSPQTGEVVVRDRRHNHIRDIHRAQVGDHLRVGILNGLVGSGRVIELKSDQTRLRVEMTQSPPPPLDLTLLIALPRPKFLNRVLQVATSLGVKQLYLFNSYRVQKVYWSCQQLSDQSVLENLILGLEQARDTVLPQVYLRRLFKPFVEDELPQLVKNKTALVAHPTASVECPRGPVGPLVLAVGPEGGFIDYEVKSLEKAGLIPVQLGERILKVETAVTALISRLS